MSKLRNRVTGRLLPLAFAFGMTLVSTGPASAQDSTTLEPAPQVVVQPQSQDAGTIEAIIVTGQRTLQSLMSEAARETESFYARLNEVLANPDFHITCRNEYPTGSNISRRVCRMRYQEELDSRAALSAIQGLESVTDTETGDIADAVFRGVPYDIVPEARRMMQQFETDVVQAVNADPQLNASVVRLLQLKSAVENYETSRQEERRERREAEEAVN